MTKQRFLKAEGIGALILILLITIIEFAMGESLSHVLNNLSAFVPIIIIMGGVFYFFWWLVSMGLAKPKPGAVMTETKRSKGYVPYLDRKAALDKMPNVKKLWMALIAYMVLSSIYGIIRLGLEFIQNGNLSKAQEVLKGIPLTGLAIGGTLTALMFIVAQIIYIGSIYRMENWVRWFMLLGFLLIIYPSFKASNLYALVANAVILGIYSYIIKRVYSTAK